MLQYMCLNVHLQPGADWTYRPTALRAVGPWLKFIMFSSAYLPSLEIIFESSQKDPYILDFLQDYFINVS